MLLETKKTNFFFVLVFFVKNIDICKKKFYLINNTTNKRGVNGKRNC